MKINHAVAKKDCRQFTLDGKYGHMEKALRRRKSSDGSQKEKCVK